MLVVLLAAVSPRMLELAALGLGRVALGLAALATVTFGLASLATSGVVAAGIGFVVYAAALHGRAPAWPADAWAYVRALH